MQTQRLEDHILASVADEPPEFLDFQETDEVAVPDGPASTDDPVRVYLREMGSVRLLSRQGEIDLARRIERGKQRMRKAISRCPLTWRAMLAIYEGVRDHSIRLDDLIEGGRSDEARREEARAEVTAGLAKLARVHQQLVTLERKAEATPQRHVNVRAQLSSKRPWNLLPIRLRRES